MARPWPLDHRTAPAPAVGPGGVVVPGLGQHVRLPPGPRPPRPARSPCRPGDDPAAHARTRSCGVPAAALASHDDGGRRRFGHTGSVSYTHLRAHETVL